MFDPQKMENKSKDIADFILKVIFNRFLSDNVTV